MNGEAVTVLQPGTDTDRYNNTILDWSDPGSTVVPGCQVDPGTSTEVLDGRDAVVSTITVYMPPGTAVTCLDRLTVRGGTYEVVGDPATWVTPRTGAVKGLVVSAKRVTG